MRVNPWSGLLLISCLALAQSGVNGVWQIHTVRPDGTSHNEFLDLQQNGTAVTGAVVDNYHRMKILNGSFQNGTLRFQVNPWRQITVAYEGNLKQGDLDLTVTRKDDPSAAPQVQNQHATPSTSAALQPPARLPVPALRDLPDNGLVRTPPMGWNSWNHFAEKVDDAVVRAAADAIVSNGMKDAGYIYVNIDDTWEGSRDPQGNIQPNKKFPDMKALTDYVHSKGLKIGLYSSPGPFTCGGYEGSYGHEAQDAKTYAGWGFDYLKYDWCSASAIYKNSDLQPVYQKMGDALEASGRPIVFSLCEYGLGDVWTWGAKVAGNLWRTTGDINDTWESMEKIGFAQLKIAQYPQPGHWNDPDMLEVGNGGMTTDEYRTHMTLWAMLSAPLLAGNDLQKMTQDTLDILTNKDIIAVDQDPAVHHPKQTSAQGNTEIWQRGMADGSTVVAFFNRDSQPQQMSVNWSDLGSGQPARARDLWSHSDVAVSGTSYSATVPTHGVVALRVWANSTGSPGATQKP
jgi:alpha-galactosidase